MSASKPRRRRTAVPATRLGRAVRIGLIAGEVALGGMLGGARQLAAGRWPDVSALLSSGNAQVLARRLSTLRGAAMKLGQMLSLQGEELLPAEFRDALAILRDQAWAMPAAQLHGVLGREYGAGWQARFAEFDEDPVAAASIGQVHRARARDGRVLALKIQYPGIARSIDSDVDNLATLLRWLDFLPVELDIDGLMAEAKRQLHVEADYLQEAEHVERYRGLLGDDPGFVVPRVHRDLSTRRILAMDYVEAEPFESVCEAGQPHRLRNDLARRLQSLMFRELFEFRCLQTDPNPANYRYQRGSRRLVLLDFGSTMELDRARMEDYRGICRAVMADDPQALHRQALALGYLRADTPPASAGGVIEIIRLVCEPIRHRGTYDFAASRLPLRARDLGLDVAFRRGLPSPPPATAFMHRKLVGTFLLCAMLRARVDVRSLIEPHL